MSAPVNHFTRARIQVSATLKGEGLLHTTWCWPDTRGDVIILYSCSCPHRSGHDVPQCISAQSCIWYKWYHHEKEDLILCFISFILFCKNLLGDLFASDKPKHPFIQFSFVKTLLQAQAHVPHFPGADRATIEMRCVSKWQWQDSEINSNNYLTGLKAGCNLQYWGIFLLDSTYCRLYSVGKYR